MFYSAVFAHYTCKKGLVLFSIKFSIEYQAFYLFIFLKILYLTIFSTLEFQNMDMFTVEIFFLWDYSQ